MNYKPFDTEAAKRGEAVITRMGKQVKEFRYMESASGSRIFVGTVDGVLTNWLSTGEFTSCVSPLDLFMAPKKFKRWVNVYDDPRCCGMHATKVEADINAQASRIACIEVEFEEGQGL